MAQQRYQMDREELSCLICLDLLKDSVTIPCGHNYCMNCIRSYWDGEDQKETHSCPQCRQMFMPRPDLKTLSPEEPKTRAEERGTATIVAVTYKDISRTGPESAFGYNDRSWALENSLKCTFVHNSFRTLNLGFPSSRIGVYLDHSAGILSFYRVSDTMTLIHRVQTTFTQPLYAGLSVHGSVELCELK